jgi:hypothetical protein
LLGFYERGSVKKEEEEELKNLRVLKNVKLYNVK